MMRSIRILTPLVAILLAVALMPANTFAQNPNFAGNWTLNTSESELPQAGGGGRGGMGGGASATMAVTHEGNTIKITTTRQGRDGQATEQVQEIITDGEPHTTEGQRGPTTITATWKEGKLHVVSVMTFNMQGQTREFTTNDVYSIQGDKLIKVTSRENMRDGSTNITKAVYDKKD